ncbi:hypothetical protein ZWY2020_048598 [Hordeum vulgare]|nr:hypothetical protein ZWY2020_048598 [Hordeum vulgare]
MIARSAAPARHNGTDENAPTTRGPGWEREREPCRAAVRHATGGSAVGRSRCSRGRTGARPSCPCPPDSGKRPRFNSDPQWPWLAPLAVVVTPRAARAVPPADPYRE